MNILFKYIYKKPSCKTNNKIMKSMPINDTFLENRWGIIENSVITWSTYCSKYIMLATILAALVASNLIIWQPIIKPYAIYYFPEWRQLLEWQAAFLGTQITILGVVYPLAIGLISLIFQSKSARVVSFVVYQKYSGFIFAGLSGLTLSGFIVTSYFLRALMSDAAYAAICATSALWFLSNVILTTWFFTKTLKTLNENFRERILFRFFTQEILWDNTQSESSQGLSDKQFDINLSDAIRAFAGPANDAIKNNDAKEFSDSIRKMSLWYAEMGKALAFKDDEGKSDNWIIKKNWNKSCLDEIITGYYRLSKEAVERIPNNPIFYKDILNFNQDIFFKRKSLTEKEISDLIKGSFYAWKILIEWRSHYSESSSSDTLSKYRGALYEFIGAWEYWLYIIRGNNWLANNTDKKQYALNNHLKFTLHTAIYAFQIGNSEAIGWGIDMLNRWLYHTRIIDASNPSRVYRSLPINRYFLQANLTRDICDQIIDIEKYDQESLNYASFRNTHADLRVIASCYMLSISSSVKPDVLIEYIESLLSGEGIQPKENGHKSLQGISSAADLLISYIRQRDYCNKSYGQWLSTLIDSFDKFYKEPRITNRIYSGSEVDKIQSMRRAYVEIAIYLSKNKWKLPSDFYESLFSNLFNDDSLKLIVSDLEEWVKVANDGMEYLLIRFSDKETLVNNFTTSVEKVIDKINKNINESMA